MCSHNQIGPTARAKGARALGCPMDTFEGSWSRYAPVRGQGYVLAQGSCFDLVKALPDASVDLVCVDPPYTQGSSAPVDPKVCSYENVAWSEAQWRAIL